MSGVPSISGAWWQRGAWREPERQVSINGNPALFREKNPACKHDACSYTIMHCEECRKFSAMVLAGRNEKKNPPALGQATGKYAEEI